MGLLDGKICLKMRCYKCCLDTQMILTPSDIERISQKTGLKREDFAWFDGKYWRLKNVYGHCIFLDPITGRCKIYEIRPLGCQAYPVIEKNGICVPDYTYCPYAHLLSRKELIEGCKILRKIFKELKEKPPEYPKF